jgi:acyl-CoA dehydrogenase family protein 9
MPCNPHRKESIMRQSDFLYNVYRGYLDQSIFQAYRGPRDIGKIETILNTYKELLNEYPPRELEDQGRIPDEMLRKMGEAGLFGISVPESYGGVGIDLWDQLKIVEGVASLDMSAALVFLAHLLIGIKGIELFGTESQKQKYLVPAASGDMIFSYALTEPKIGSDARHIETKAELSEDGTFYILSGVKTYITNANYAQGLTVFAQLDPQRPGFMGAFIVETAWEGVKVGRDMPKMGLKSSSTAMIRFDNVRVPAENLLGDPGDGYKIAMIILNYGRLGLMAASSGVTKQSCEDMRSRAKARIQFGAPIETFPLIQEKIVRGRVHGFVMEAMNYFSAGLLENDPEHNPVIETSHCKLFGTTRAWDILYDALQVAGGSGFIATQPYEKRMRDFRVTTIFEGTTEIHSIYPSLFAIGRLGKEMMSRTGVKRWIYLVREFILSFGKMDWRLHFDEKALNDAVKLAKANARAVRRMLVLGLVVYRKKVGEQEYFLRRITTLSVYLFGVLSLLAKISADRYSGKQNRDDLNLLDYFLEEARNERKTFKRYSDTKIEKLTSLIFKNLQ